MTSIRIGEITDEQLEFLQLIGFESASEIFRIAVDRLYIAEKRKWREKMQNTKTLHQLLTHDYGEEKLDYVGDLFGSSMDADTEYTTGKWMWNQIGHLISHQELLQNHQVINPVLQKDKPGWFTSSCFLIYRFPDGFEDKIFKIRND